MFSWFSIIGKLLPFVVTLISLAESAFGAKTGLKKKAFVMEALKVVVGIMLAVSTGGQLETWERISPKLSKVVDLLVDIIFPQTEFDVSV
jgi:hypothetical protein